jgi:phosphatidate phosphatase APP1
MGKRIDKLLGRYKVEKVHIVPYRSYGTPIRLYIKGRVLDNLPLEFLDNHDFWQTIRNSFRQFNTHEIANMKVCLTIGASEIYTVTDRKGYFLFNETLGEDVTKYADKEGWVKYNISVPTEPQAEVNEVFQGEFLIPEKDADYGIITDIDDTILSTGVTSFLKLKVLYNSFFVNAYKRMPLEGAPELYQKLHKGVEGKEKNPVFYISNSPWNMYQYLKLFLDHNNFPRGPILLRSFNSIFQRAVTPEKPHKQKEIINILDTYKDLKFILIGDSGEHDASIYTDIAAQFPERILCIYLRSVKHKRKMEHVKSIVDSFRTTPALLVEKSIDAEAHAKQQGYI